jgi:hemerythrin-like domain-containing protein
MERVLARFEGELCDPQGEGLLALARTFGEITQRLAAHFRKEEEVFYPALAPLLAATDKEISKLTGDHTDVRETFSAFQDLLDQARATTEPGVSVRADLSTIGWELWNLIHHHIATEERGLLAFADRQLDSTAQARLAAQMKAAG